MLDLQQRIGIAARQQNVAAAAAVNLLQQNKPDHVVDLAITMNYVELMEFGVSDAIREVIKNALEGAIYYAKVKLQIPECVGERLEPSGLFKLQPVNLPKFVQQLGFKYGYESRMTLILSGLEAVVPQISQRTSQDWSSQDPRALAQIRACYASREYVDVTDLQEEGPIILEDLGLVLYQLITENYAEDIAANNFICLGDSSNSPSRSLGEGLKLAAIAALNDGFQVEVSGKGITYRYEASPDQQSNTAQHLRAVISRSHILSADHPDIIQVKLTRHNHWHTPARFVREEFRSLQISKPHLIVHSYSGGEILLHPHFVNKLFCRGVFVCTCQNLLGIDLDFKLSRDKNKPFDLHKLKSAYGRLLHEVLTDASQAHKNVALQLIERMKGCHLPTLESDVITGSDFDPVGIAAKAIATKFRQINGNQAMPCRDQKDFQFIQKHLPKKIPIIVSQYLLECLYRGGYRRPLEELESHFTVDNDKNISSIDTHQPTTDAIITQAIRNLKLCGYENMITRYSLIFVDHNRLASCKQLCRYNLDQNVFFINDLLLSQDYYGGVNASLEFMAYMLGYHLSREHPRDDLHLNYIQNSSILLGNKKDSMFDNNQYDKEEYPRSLKKPKISV